jgi:hypothetical protein
MFGRPCARGCKKARRIEAQPRGALREKKSEREAESDALDTLLPSARSSGEMLSNVSTSSMTNFCLLILTTSAAFPLCRVNLNLRIESLSSCGMSTVWDWDASGKRKVRPLKNRIWGGGQTVPWFPGRRGGKKR